MLKLRAFYDWLSETFRPKPRKPAALAAPGEKVRISIDHAYDSRPIEVRHANSRSGVHGV